MPADIERLLRETFGHEGFRPHQEEVIRRVLEGRDVLAVLPTAAGKSLCYQLPALLLPQPTLVVSPLIALMKDQAENLPPLLRGAATVINSSVGFEELDRRLRGVAEGRYRLIYAAPERLRQREFAEQLTRIGISLLVVDEAHCVSVWGHDFRPDYLFIRKVLQHLDVGEQRPVLLALTATATEEMRRAIASQLGREPEVVVAPVRRPNLHFEAHKCANADEKMRRLLRLCRHSPGAAIVYANSRERCERLAAYLRRNGIQAAHYHAGMGAEERKAAQERFMTDEVPVIVATVAFGMGVNKPDVRLVAHFTLPESVEAYSQEAGRAGRDGRPSRCALLYAPSDKANLTRWTKASAVHLPVVGAVYRALKARLGRSPGAVRPDSLLQEVFGERTEGAETALSVSIAVLEACTMLERLYNSGRDMVIEMLPPPPGAREAVERLLASRQAHAEARIAEIAAYAEGMDCRHVSLARHFGQDTEACGSCCDACAGVRIGPAAKPDPAPIPDDVGRLILGTVQGLPIGVGRTGLVKILHGAPDAAVGRGRCRTYGALAAWSKERVGRAIQAALDRGWLATQPDDEYRRLSLTESAIALLAQDGIILASSSLAGAAAFAGKRQRDPDDRGLQGEAYDRWERLRAWRLARAQQDEVPAFVVFSDATLRAVAWGHPRTLDELGEVPGVGPVKLARYGGDVLDVLRQ